MPKNKIQVYNLPQKIAEGIERDAILQRRSESEAALNALLAYYTMSDDLRQDIEIEAKQENITEAEMITRIIEGYFNRNRDPQDRVGHKNPTRNDNNDNEKSDILKSVAALLESLSKSNKLCWA